MNVHMHAYILSQVEGRARYVQIAAAPYIYIYACHMRAYILTYTSNAQNGQKGESICCVNEGFSAYTYIYTHTRIHTCIRKGRLHAHFKCLSRALTSIHMRIYPYIHILPLIHIYTHMCIYVYICITHFCMRT